MVPSGCYQNKLTPLQFYKEKWHVAHDLQSYRLL